MPFNDIAKDATSLDSEQQAKMLFALLGKLDGYYRYDLDHVKHLTKEQAVQLAREALHEVK